MRLLALVVRRGLRRNWVGWLFVALLTALTLAGFGSAIAVERQTLDAYPQLLDAVDAADLTIGIGNPDYPDEEPVPIAPEEIATLDGVAELRVQRLINGTELLADGQPDLTFRTGIVAAVDGAPALPLVDGRWPAADSPDEVAVSLDALDNLAVALGDSFRYLIATTDDNEISAVELNIVGVFGSATVDGPADAPARNSLIIASGAFLDAHPGVGQYQTASVWLRDDTTVDVFLRSLEERYGVVDVETRVQDEAKARRAVQPEALAALGLGVAAALVGLTITALAVARQMNDGSTEVSYLAIGLTRRQRALQRWAQALVAIAVGAVLGIVGTIVIASMIGPIGIADAFDRTSLAASEILVAAGAAVLLSLVLLAFAAASAWLRSGIVRQPQPPATPPAWMAAVMSAAPMEVRTGAALSGRGTGAHRATRAAIIGTATSVAVSVGVITFAYSLDALVSTPALYGSNYDLTTWDLYGQLDDDVITDSLRADADIAEISRAAGSTGTVNGREAGLTGFDNFAVGPFITSGRKPISDDEVLLGRRLASRLDVGIGDDVTVSVGDANESYEVVGLGVLPDGIGDSAAFTLEGVQRIAPDAEVGSQYVTLRNGAESDKAVAHYQGSPACAQGCEITVPSAPTDIAYLDTVGSLPRWSVAVVVFLGVALSIHALLIVGRRSRRAIAILRALGATRRQVTRFLLSQALLISLSAVSIGVILGVLLGRFVWGLFADELGVVPRATTSSAAIAVSVVALMIVTIAAAIVPARRSAGRAVAPELHAD